MHEILSGPGGGVWESSQLISQYLKIDPQLIHSMDGKIISNSTTLAGNMSNLRGLKGMLLEVC